MNKNRANGMRRPRSRSKEAGQATLFLMLGLGIFLLGALCFAFDMSNMWFHRQAAQTAADAACAAGAMDLLVDSQGGATGNQGFTPGTNYSCTTTATDSVCKYAAKNGYNGNNTSPGNVVNVSFPSSVIGVAAPPSGIAPNPFIRVDIVDHVQTFFLGLFSGGTTKDVLTFSTCGLVLANAPIPIIVLHPTLTSSLSESGTPVIKILGGPPKSIQVDSGATTAVNIGGSSSINLTKGGPNYDGSSLGSYGGPTTAPTGFTTSGSGTWISPAAPINDPYAQVAAPTTVPGAPSVPTDLTYGAAGNACEWSGRGAKVCTPNPCSSTDIQSGLCFVSHNTHGCPDPGATTPPTPANGCQLYTAGNYPSGITLDGSGGINAVAIFDPGLYYLNGGLALKSGSMVRPGTGTGDGSQGTVFYLTGAGQTCSGQSGLVCVGSNSGKSGLDAFTTANVQCTGGPAPDVRLGLPTTLDGNVLLAPCTGTYGDPAGQYRGFLFFQDRSSDIGGGWGGGGGFLLAGTMYFHMCNAAGTGISCSATVCTRIGSCAAGSSFGSNFTLQGSSGSASYVLGQIITDTLTMGGTPAINMSLNPNSTYTTLKASLLQ
jgi:Putative Flp pilus-assembly TadE/G-like